MSEVGVVRVVRRRWYVVLPLLLLTALLTAGVDKAVPTQYQSTSTITLLASQGTTKGTATVPGTGNPFLSFGPSLNETADLLVRRLNSSSSGERLQALGVTQTYVAALAANAQGPFITLTVTGTDIDHVRKSGDVLVTFCAAQLRAVQQQAAVPQIDMITSMVIVPPAPPTAQTKSKTQDLAAAAIGGLVLTFSGAIAAESLAAARRRRRRGRATSALQPESGRLDQPRTGEHPEAPQSALRPEGSPDPHEAPEPAAKALACQLSDLRD